MEDLDLSIDTQEGRGSHFQWLPLLLLSLVNLLVA